MPMRLPYRSLSVSNPGLPDFRTLAYRFQNPCLSDFRTYGFQTHANLTSVPYPIGLWSFFLSDFQTHANATSVPQPIGFKPWPTRLPYPNLSVPKPCQSGFRTLA